MSLKMMPVLGKIGHITHGGTQLSDAVGRHGRDASGALRNVNGCACGGERREESAPHGPQHASVCGMLDESEALDAPLHP